MCHPSFAYSSDTALLAFSTWTHWQIYQTFDLPWLIFSLDGLIE